MDEIENQSSLDTSWMNEIEKEISINTNYDKEFCNEINMYFLFVDVDNNIHKVSSDKETLTMREDACRIITKERLLQIIEAKKRENPKIKYRLNSMLLYCNETNPNDIRTYAKTSELTEISKNVLNVLSIFNDVVIPKSIFVFHSINAVYFIFKQVPIKNVVVRVSNNIKSILKVKTKHAKPALNGGDHSVTKKVSFHEEGSVNITKPNTTKKNMDDHTDSNEDVSQSPSENKNNTTRRL